VEHICSTDKISIYKPFPTSANAKKAEKALTDANKEHLQQEQAMAERLNTMSAAAGGTYYTFLSFCGFVHSLMLADIFLF
jgi:hypothetical protein